MIDTCTSCYTHPTAAQSQQSGVTCHKMAHQTHARSLFMAYGKGRAVQNAMSPSHHNLNLKRIPSNCIVNIVNEDKYLKIVRLQTYLLPESLLPEEEYRDFQ